MSLRDKLNATNISNAFQTQAGKNVLLYMLFVLVAFIFWILLSLDNEVQKDFEIPVELTGVPDSTVVISELPPSLSVSVKAKGSQLISLLWRSRMPALKINFDDARKGQNKILISRSNLDSRLREYFGTGASILSCRPDSLKIEFTSNKGKRLKLMVNADVHADRQSVINGPLQCNTDSVTIFAVGEIPASLKYVETEPIVRSGLRDTTRFAVKIKPIVGVRIVPDEVTVTVPVEPLITKKVQIPVKVLNVPENLSIAVFPSKVELSYLVPMSAYSEDFQMFAYANYDDIRPGTTKLGLTMSMTSELLKGLTLKPDSVEYIVLQNP